jgi:hypothetical protein
MLQMNEMNKENIIQPFTRQTTETSIYSPTFAPKHASINGSDLEAFSDSMEVERLRHVSAQVPTHTTGIVSYNSYRISVDGANIEELSDNINMNKRRQSFSPSLGSGIMPTSPPDRLSNAPKRSRFANRRRAPPRPISTQRRGPSPTSPLPEGKVWDDVQPNTIQFPLTPPPEKIRAMISTLPRLSIPPNKRPPVEIVLHSPAASPIVEVPSVTHPLRIPSFGKYKLPSPPDTPALSCNISSPLELDFPELSFRGSSPSDSDPPESPINIENFDSHIARLPDTKFEESPYENMTLIDAIYQILRSPTESNDLLPSFPLRTSIPASATNLVSPLFSVIDRFDPRSRKSCNTCGDELTSRNFPNRTTKRCRHASSSCKKCLLNWIAASVDAGNLENIRCPDTDCREVLNDGEIRSHLIAGTTVKAK